jgi:hypothetical protein
MSSANRCPPDLPDQDKIMTKKENTLYKRNLEALAQFHPHVVPSLETSVPFPMSIGTAPSGLPNLYFKESPEGETRPLYPETGPIAGLSKALARMKEIRGRIVCHYGFGLGFHAIEIVRSLASANIVVLFEAHPAVFKSALTHVDLVDVLSHPNVRMVVGAPVDFFEFLSGDPEEIFASLQHVAIRFDRGAALAPAWYEGVSKAMATYNHYQIETQNTLAVAGHKFIKNRFRNLMAMSRAVPMERTAGILSGMPAVLVAAGPSLSKNIDYLKTMKGRALLVAVDSAVGPMAQRGISPDMVASVDYRALTYEKLGPFRESLRNTGLIFSDHASFEVLNYLPFKTRFFTFSGFLFRDVFNRVLETQIAAPMKQSQSVFHLAMHFALQAGCDPIIFTGLDLAFDGSRDHAEGTVLHWGNQQEIHKNSPMVPDIHDRMIPTDPGFLNMLITCEQRIQETPDRTWIDATEGGAKISGTEIMALEEAFRRFCTKPVDVSRVFDLPATGVSADQMSKTLEALRGEIRACLERIETFYKYASQVDDYLSKSRIPERGAAGLPEDIRVILQKIEGISSGTEELALRKILADFVTGPRLDIVREHRAKVLEAKASKSKAASFIYAYEQLKASQAIWRDGFHHFLKLLDSELGVYNNLNRLKEKSPEQDDSHTARLAAYFKYGYLWLAEQCLDKIPSDDAAAEFYSGAIRLKQGDVAAGLELMKVSAQKDPTLRGEMAQIVSGVENEWLSAEGPYLFMAIMRKRLMQMGPSEKVLETFWPKDVATMNRFLSEEYISPATLTEVGVILSDWEEVKDKLPEWWAIKAHSLSARGLPAEGVAAIETALSMGEKKNPQWLALSARLLIESGQVNEGISKLGEAVALDPQTAVLWEEIGDALAVGKDYDGALAAYEKCLSVLPDRHSTLKKVGDCYSAAGHTEAARMAYARAQSRQGNRDVENSRNG